MYLLSRVLAFILVILLSPVFLVVAAIVWCSLGRPLFFCRERTGYKGVPFQMIKFRTMTDTKDRDGNLLDDRLRLTTIGNFLRRTSLDELPQLWNIVRGELAFIGPRPLPTAYLKLYDEQTRKRISIRQGITGWAQIHGRNQLTWDEKFALDSWYVEHKSWWVDIKILLRTPWKVLDGQGSKQPGTLFRG